ncbi:hypothetical protein OAU13_00025 [bacterium]|nr:hypothetical protein [bacterium]
MAIITKVTVANQRLSGAVTVKRVDGGLQQTNKVNPISVITGAAASGNRFDELLDVTEGTPANGDVVVYNASNDKYEVKSLSNTSITLDGGTF